MSQSTSGRSKRTSRTKGGLRKHGTIDGVIVEEPFSLSLPNYEETTTASNNKPSSSNFNAPPSSGEMAGHGCYVSCTAHGKRYYGVLIEQAALKSASDLFFRDESESLELNRRMDVLLRQQQQHTEHQQSESNNNNETNDGREGSSAADSVDAVEPPAAKRLKKSSSKKLADDTKQPKLVEQFRYVPQINAQSPGYRILVATYADIDAAAQFDATKADEIRTACESGGNWVVSSNNNNSSSKFYYQYQVGNNALISNSTKSSVQQQHYGIHLSMGMQSFLHNTMLPNWHPLSNLEGCNRASSVLNMFNLKAKHNMSISYQGNKKQTPMNVASDGAVVVVAPRAAYKIAIIGAGMSGLACALQLLRDANDQGIEIEVVVYEARKRIGGRVFSDDSTFVDGSTGAKIVVDLGAQFIHGTEDNPLVQLTKEAGLNLLTQDEVMKMLQEGMREVDDAVEGKVQKLFNSLLDETVSSIWDSDPSNAFQDSKERQQRAVRFYASGFCNNDNNKNNPTKADTPEHRYSADISVDTAVGMKLKDWLEQNPDEISLDNVVQNLLRFEMKNLEYALGAGLDSLSIKYFNSDEEFDFDGGHAQLKLGYMKLVHYLLKQCKKFKNFSYRLNSPVQKIEYARSVPSYPLTNRRDARKFKLIDLSDTCRVTTATAKDDHNMSSQPTKKTTTATTTTATTTQTKVQTNTNDFDFVVSSLPLGCLKESVLSTEAVARGKPALQHAVQFDPPLPPSKVDAIQNVGYGLLNKVYLQFPHAFWRAKNGATVNDLKGTPFLHPTEYAFANASAINPQHFMFKDIGRMKYPSTTPNDDVIIVDPPAILMTMISGKDAVKLERSSDENVICSVMITLRTLYSRVEVPQPIHFKVTRWGSDPYSRGCYTYMAPGCTDQDYLELARPLSGNKERGMRAATGTSMRLFFAGEHTTESHPSTAHGAYLSGGDAAKRILLEMKQKTRDGEVDEHVSIAEFRRMFPNHSMCCQLCNKKGDTKREGDLYGFRKGNNYTLAHLHCASFCPEVHPEKGWGNILKEVNRGKRISCTMCKQPGATIGCSSEKCMHSYHYACAKFTGWSFMRRGRNFFCGKHRHEAGSSVSPSDSDYNDDDDDEITAPMTDIVVDGTATRGTDNDGAVDATVVSQSIDEAHKNYSNRGPIHHVLFSAPPPPPLTVAPPPATKDASLQNQQENVVGKKTIPTADSSTPNYNYSVPNNGTAPCAAASSQGPQELNNNNVIQDVNTDDTNKDGIISSRTIIIQKEGDVGNVEEKGSPTKIFAADMEALDRGNEGDLENNSVDGATLSSDNNNDDDDVDYSSVRNSSTDEDSDQSEDDEKGSSHVRVVNHPNMEGVTIGLLERHPLTPQTNRAAAALLRRTHPISINIMCQRVSSSVGWYLPMLVHSTNMDDNNPAENNASSSSTSTSTPTTTSETSVSGNDADSAAISTLRIVDDNTIAIGNSTADVDVRYHHGLLPDDVIVSVNGQMVGGQELPNLGSILNIMRSNLLHLMLGILRKESPDCGVV